MISSPNHPLRRLALLADMGYEFEFTSPVGGMAAVYDERYRADVRRDAASARAWHEQTKPARRSLSLHQRLKPYIKL